MYLLIIGAPRSGTTLLASMIGMHTEVAMLIEDRFFSIRKLTGKKILANKLCIPIQLELTQKSNVFIKAAQKVGFLKNFSVSKFNANDYLGLQDLKIIGIIREKNHVIRSIMKRGKKEKHIANERWNRAVEIIDELNKRHSGKTAIISYEDLVSDPEKLLRKVSDFLEIEFQPQMMEGYKYNILYPGESGIDKSRASQLQPQEIVNGSFADKISSNELYNKLLKIKLNP